MKKRNKTNPNTGKKRKGIIIRMISYVIFNLLLMTTIFITSLITSNIIRKNNEEYMRENSQMLANILINSTLNSIDTKLLELLYQQKEENLAEILAENEDMFFHYEDYRRVAQEYNLLQDLSFAKESEVLLLNMRGFIVQCTALYREKKIREAREFYSDRVKKSINVLKNYVEDIVAAKQKTIKKIQEKTEEVNRRTNLVTMIIISLAIFLEIIFSLIFSRAIIKPVTDINRISDIIGGLEEGKKDLRETGDTLRKLNINLRDEVGILYSTLRGMLSFLVELTSKIKEIAFQLNANSREIKTGVERQLSSASDYASRVTEISGTLDELTGTAKRITDNTGALVTSSEEVVKALQNGEKELASTVKQLDAVGEISQNNASLIRELGSKSVLINEMVDIIKDVAKKTNMLSLNAYIEASRAGQVGRGFGVVASEIRELSKETLSSVTNVEDAAIEIKKLITSIITSSEDEVKTVLASGQVVKNISGILVELVDRINSNFDFTRKIDSSVKHQLVGSRQASETMKQMAEIAKQTVEIARQISVAIKEIVQLHGQLDKATNRFAESSSGV